MAVMKRTNKSASLTKIKPSSKDKNPTIKMKKAPNRKAVIKSANKSLPLNKDKLPMKDKNPIIKMKNAPKRKAVIKNANKSLPLSKGKLPKRDKSTIVKEDNPRTKRKMPNVRVQKGVVYLSHIPHGFYEEQINKYFKQFGKVTNVSMPRSKTGRSKGFAFIEFEHPEVAEIAAETMNNYLMFKRLLKATYIPPKEQKPFLFASAKRAKVTKSTVPEKAKKNLIKNRTRKNRNLDEKSEIKLAKRLVKRKDELKSSLEKLGLDYEFDVKKGNVQKLLKKSIK